MKSLLQQIVEDGECFCADNVAIKEPCSYCHAKAVIDWIKSASKDERSLVLFLESCAVDKGGRLATVHMNSDDMETAEGWNRTGFLSFGRIASQNVSRHTSHWCHLTSFSAAVAAEERFQRSARLWISKNYQTTTEKRQEAA